MQLQSCCLQNVLQIYCQRGKDDRTAATRGSRRSVWACTFVSLQVALPVPLAGHAPAQAPLVSPEMVCMLTPGCACRTRSPCETHDAYDCVVCLTVRSFSSYSWLRLRTRAPGERAACVLLNCSDLWLCLGHGHDSTGDTNMLQARSLINLSMEVGCVHTGHGRTNSAQVRARSHSMMRMHVRAEEPTGTCDVQNA